jgi:TatD DNase family protein
LTQNRGCEGGNPCGSRCHAYAAATRWIPAITTTSARTLIGAAATASAAYLCDATRLRDLVDIGINLTHRSFEHDREAVVARASAAGVATLIITGTSVRDSQRALELAHERPATCFSTAGVHPHHAKECDARTIETLRGIAADPNVVAIGECGLDFNRNFSPPDVQERWFEAQLELAAEVGKPVFLHERDAHDRMVAILAAHRPKLAGGVVHCFTGTTAQVERYLALDLHVGITGWICDERRGASLVEAARAIPLDRLMIETDGPFLLPRTLTGKAAKERRNEPAFLPEVVKALARAMKRDELEIATETTRTARRFFGLAAA